ncbi:hypothetical protein [Ruegeria sp. HKCCD6109]|uniref:hypothetical protein n=1 Tax=Ruegeria sp. HKCCD6109 TaxID=2683017 RepID=UPI001492E5D7|nr:hypothetical protein [Ruegeria sp. HKCCD6109]NOD65752.1 hypothetical protein [Ruegeria sp. HKCCD6109]
MFDWALLYAAGAGLLGVIAAFLGTYRMGRREGALGAEKDALEESDERQKDGRDAVAKEQADTDGLSGGDIVDRLRSRDRDWRGL